MQLILKNFLSSLFIILVISLGSAEASSSAGPAARAAPETSEARAAAGKVYYVRAEGVINPVMAEYLIGGILKAEEEKAQAIIIELDTPGGLDLSMREIIKTELGSSVPVVVYVAPAGSRAASAGVFITMAAHVAAMAPGTNIGSAHPVAMGGEKMDETMLKKVENDAAAYIKGIARKRNRNADWAEEAVRKSVNVTAEEALKLKVIDLVAVDRQELLAKINNMKVQLPTGPATLHTEGAVVEVFDMGLRERILKAISDPNVAYVLMMIGMLGLYFELSSPGTILPGVVGAISLVLAFYALNTLDINYAGLLLIGLAVIFFIVEINVVSYGLLTMAGLVALVLGSIMLFDSPLPFMTLSPWVMGPTIIFMAGFVGITMFMAIRMRGQGSVAGAEGFIGLKGRAVESFGAGGRGRVFVEGEYWDATGNEALEEGDAVVVLAIKGLLLTVQKEHHQ
ncbi:MAG: nodulation protein NfeD [Thermodesulfobacteriota bacterium]